MRKIKFKKRLLIIAGIIIVLLTIWWYFLRYQNIYDVHEVSNHGLELLNDYEGINIIDWEIDSEGDYCAKAYDVGDGVITFGFGQTFDDEKTGIDYLNNVVEGDYQVGDCLKQDDLYQLETDDLKERNKKINHLDRKYKMNLNQQQFDAIMLMFYLNEATIYNKEFWQLLQNPEIDETMYENYFLTQYQEFNDFDIYGEGWTLRIVDSAQLYFYDDYQRDY